MSRRTPAQKRLDAAWTLVLRSEEGRIVLAALIRSAGLLDASFQHGDPLSTAHAEGKRAVARHIYTTATSNSQGAYLTALMAEVMPKPNERDDLRRSAEPDDADDPGAE